MDSWKELDVFPAFMRCLITILLYSIIQLQRAVKVDFSESTCCVGVTTFKTSLCNDVPHISIICSILLFLVVIPSNTVGN